ADEHQRPVAVQLARHQLRAVGLHQAEGRDLARLREQLHDLQGRLARRFRAVEHAACRQQAEASGERRQQDDERSAVEHRVPRESTVEKRHDTRAAAILAGRLPRVTGAMTDELQTIIDLIRYGASRFNAAGLTYGHSYDNALDEATQLTLHALHLPHDLNPVYGNARVTLAEKEEVLALFLRRIEERVPAAYLTGEAWFAGLNFKCDRRALVPRSPIAELI